MNKLPDLSDHELHAVLLNALSCAADKYDENARLMRCWGQSPANRELGDQFELQANDARALATKLEEESTDA